MDPMKTVCAASVLHGREAFEALGEVVVLPDRQIARADLLDADALVIRSKTRADRALLEGTHVSFVGTATAGFDHLDPAWLEDSGIRWCAAAGCNATSVAEYVVSALLSLANRHGFTLGGRTLGVVGVGQVGRRVVARARALGMDVRQNDPPRQLAEGDAELRPLDEILPDCDIVTLHVPLTDGGPFATRGMADCRFLARLKPGAIFFNASRGEVVDETALKLALARGQVSRAVLDVWDHEPDCDPELLRVVEFGTPHIAGYSWDGKLTGTEMIYREACRFFELESRAWSRDTVPSPGGNDDLRADVRGLSFEEALWAIVRQAYDIARDDRDLREPPEPDPAARAERFERLRKKYWTRREFNAFTVHAVGADDRLRGALAALGFKVAAAATE